MNIRSLSCRVEFKILYRKMDLESRLFLSQLGITNFLLRPRLGARRQLFRGRAGIINGII
jgi:hypothetical protein